MQKNISFNYFLALVALLILGCGNNSTGTGSEDTKWVSMDSHTLTNFHSVWGTSSNNVYAIGEGNIFHYNGSDWSKIEMPSSYYIHALWGNSAQNVYAVGKSGLIMHFNGVTWERILTNSQDNFSDIAGINNSSIFIQDGINSVASFNNGILKSHHLNTKFSVLSLWGISDLAYPLTEKISTNYLLVGGSGGIALSINNNIGTQSVTPSIFRDVHGTSMRNVFIVGYPARVVYFNGISFEILANPFSNIYDIQGVWTTGYKSAYFVSTFGKIYYLNEDNWIEQNSETTDHLFGIWGSSDGTMFAVGYNGTILKSVTE